jgi:hypothetical protein
MNSVVENETRIVAGRIKSAPSLHLLNHAMSFMDGEQRLAGAANSPDIPSYAIESPSNSHA